MCVKYIKTPSPMKTKGRKDPNRKNMRISRPLQHSSFLQAGPSALPLLPSGGHMLPHAGGGTGKQESISL